MLGDRRDPFGQRRPGRGQDQDARGGKYRSTSRDQ